MVVQEAGGDPVLRYPSQAEGGEPGVCRNFGNNHHLLQRQEFKPLYGIRAVRDCGEQHWTRLPQRAGVRHDW